MRIEWGRLDGAKTADAARQWRGEVSIDRGQLTLVRSLGLEADAPGSVSAENGRLEIHPGSARISDGLDVLVTATLDAALSVELHDAQSPTAAPVVTTVPLLDLIAKPTKRDLDKAGNRMIVRRAPGDSLRVVLHRDTLVFSPSESLQLDVEPRLLNEPAGTTLQIRGRLVPLGGGAELNVQEQTIKTTAEQSTPASIPWQFALPASEGVYEVVIEAFEPATLRSFGKSKLVAERRVQVVVVADRSTSALEGNVPWSVVMEIDPANPKWYEQRFKTWLSLPGLVQGTLGNISLQPWQGTIGAAVQLARRCRRRAALASLSALGGPARCAAHLRSGSAQRRRQSLSISIVESTAANGSAGTDRETALDSGLFVDEESLPGPSKWAKHRIVFWPRTKTPIVLLTNRSNNLPAVFGKIRVWAGPVKLPRDLRTRRNRRANVGRLPESTFVFGSVRHPKAVDPVSGRELDDWQTFYRGATRLAEYIEYAGYGGQMMTVMADGSTIYPSQLIAPTPAFDSGAAFESAQDPVRKDALEVILRIFDREGLKFVRRASNSTHRFPSWKNSCNAAARKPRECNSLAPRDSHTVSSFRSVQASPPITIRLTRMSKRRC